MIIDYHLHIFRTKKIWPTFFGEFSFPLQQVSTYLQRLQARRQINNNVQEQFRETGKKTARDETMQHEKLFTLHKLIYKSIVLCLAFRPTKMLPPILEMHTFSLSVRQ